MITFAGSTPAPNAFGWNTTDVTLTWNCSHSDGVVAPVVTQTVTGEGGSLSRIGTCQNLTGQTSTDRRSVNIDRTNPSITLASRTPANGSGWNRLRVDLSWTCSDAHSGPLEGAVGLSVTTEGALQSATATCEDRAGHTASATETGINIDNTPPLLTFQSRTPANAHGWNNTDVQATWRCSDTLSGVTTPFVSTIVTGEGAFFATGTCSDRAENSASNSFTGIQIDRTAPFVGVTGVDDGTVYFLGSVPVAGCFTQDGLSGVDVPASLSITGGSADGVGTITATCSGARDRAGNQQASARAVYHVRYPFAGFLAGAVIRHAPVFEGTSASEGLVRVMLPETVRFTGAAALGGDLLIPGSPTVVLQGHPSYGGTIDGGGAAMPTDHRVILSGTSSLGHVVQRTDGVDLPVVAPPPLPAGTRDVQLTRASDNPGTFSTIRDLTLTGTAGMIAVPPGTYGSLTASGRSGFVLGVAGSTAPAVYNLQSLTLNGTTSVEIVSPVIVTVEGDVVLNGSMGSAANPGWLLLRIASGGLTLNGSAAVDGFVTAPAGTVTITGRSKLTGGLAADQLIGTRPLEAAAVSAP